jgi:hypothetical protein
VSSVLVGSAYGVLELRAQQFDQGVDASLAKLAQLRQAFSQGIPPVTLPPVGGSLPGSPNAPRQLPGGLAPDIQKDEQAMLRYAQSLASAQKAQGDLSGAASTYRTVLGQLTPNTLEANRAAASLASTEAALAKEGVGAVSTQLGGLITPLTLATAGFGAATAAVASFSEAFKFKAQLDQNTASIRAQLTGVRDSTQVFNQAAAFAEKYKLTQEETTTAIQASVPLLRQSKASLTDVLTVLSQLQVLKPEQGLQGAAFALAELEGGQSRSLATRFNIPIAKATEMKNEIQKGGDAVQILGKYLDGAGNTHKRCGGCAQRSGNRPRKTEAGPGRFCAGTRISYPPRAHPHDAGCNKAASRRHSRAERHHQRYWDRRAEPVTRQHPIL